MRLRVMGATGVALVLALSACAGGDAADETPAPADPPTSDQGMDEGTGTDGAMDEGMGEPGTIVDVAAGAEDFTTLVAAVQAADLVETLQGDGPFTVFAPTDAAFAALPDGVLDALLLPENKDTLVKILTYHVAPGAISSDQISAGDVATVEGQTVSVTTDAGVQVNGANVVTPDVEASNGLIHVIDTVLLPPDVDPSTL